jgi:hypothetical protein
MAGVAICSLLLRDKSNRVEVVRCGNADEMMIVHATRSSDKALKVGRFHEMSDGHFRQVSLALSEWTLVVGIENCRKHCSH